MVPDPARSALKENLAKLVQGKKMLDVTEDEVTQIVKELLGQKAMFYLTFVDKSLL